MLSPRWKKLFSDMRAERGRLALMLAAISVSLVAVVTVLGAWAVLRREMAVNYLGTRPAEATLELREGIDRQLLDRVRSIPQVAEATSREVIRTRVQVGDDWRPLLLFVADDFNDLRLSQFYPESGAWPPPPGTLLLERSAKVMAQADSGSSLRIRAANGNNVMLPVSGIVHDPGLAPAWQERSVYAYATPDTLKLLGEAAELYELRVSFRASQSSLCNIEAAADELSSLLVHEGHQVTEIRVPPPREHPHQRQMTTILTMMLLFAGLALVLSSVLVATSLAAMLARQIREIGVMKTVGATVRQLSAMYAALVSTLGLLSVLISLPLGLHGVRGFTTSIAKMLNLNLTNPSVPVWVFVVDLAAGLLVPVALAALPILRATGMSVTDALDQFGTSLSAASWSPRALPAALRSAMRRPSRFSLTVGLLATGGALFMTSLAVSNAWEKNVEKIYEARLYDIEIRLHSSSSPQALERLRALDGVKAVEASDYASAAFARPGRIDLVHSYPDRGHGTLSIMAPPTDTQLVKFPLLAGRWLQPSDDAAVVLNHVAAAQLPKLKLGDLVPLSIAGTMHQLPLVGIVEEVGSPGVAYVTHQGFTRFAAPDAQSRLLRLATFGSTAAARAQVLGQVERLLLEQQVAVDSAFPFSELRTAIGDHIAILTRALVAMAVVLAIVGILGLGSTMAISVVERTREIAVMKAVGATSRRIVRSITAEALATAFVSYLVALLLSLPLTWLVQGIVGRLGFLAPLPFVLSPVAIIGWAALLLVSTFAATLPPAYRAAKLSVREALATAA